MTRSVFIFTFSPVQPFIAQARRAADLYSGSQILVELAKAAARAMQAAGATLIYPASLADDAPNRLVALTSDVKACLEAAQTGFDNRWIKICKTAQDELENIIPVDKTWQDIWERQTRNHWETYWAAAEMNGDDFHSAYNNARHALEAAKRARAFSQVNEDGLKDSLSGERSALRLGQADARQYWLDVTTTKRVSPSKLKPEGRERLDALGAVKRFGKLDEGKKQILPFNGFPSTSTIASQPYLRQCRSHAPLLKKYAQEIRALGCFPVREEKEDWAFDGDLFYREILDPRRLKEDYHIKKDDDDLKNARSALAALYEGTGRPSAYYAILALDGDNLGKRINACQSVPEAENLSKALTEFAQGIRDSMQIKASNLEPDVYVIYNGGDDLLAMTPLENAFQTAWEWKELFKNTVGKLGKQNDKGEWLGRTASAGIAIVHHQAPLSASLRAARTALEHAKDKKRNPGKNAVCIQARKRGSDPVEVMSRWDDLSGDLFGKIFRDFRVTESTEKSPLSSKFAFNVLEESGVTNALDPEARAASLKRLLKRHMQDGISEPETTVEALSAWAAKMDAYHAKQKDKDGKDIPQGMTALGNWLVAIRFIAQGGGE